MYKYGGYLLATILSVWTVISYLFISTWLKERNINSEQNSKEE